MTMLSGPSTSPGGPFSSSCGPPPQDFAQALAPIDRHMNSGEKPDAWAAYLDSGKGQAFGVIAGHLPSAILILPKPVSRSPPETSSIYIPQLD
jgi:hypothetical protein